MRATRRSPTTSGGFLVDLKRVTFRYWPEGALYFRPGDELWFCNAVRGLLRSENLTDTFMLRTLADAVRRASGSESNST